MEPESCFIKQIAEAGMAKHGKRLAKLWQTIKNEAMFVDEYNPDIPAACLSYDGELWFYFASDETHLPRVLYSTEPYWHADVYGSIRGSKFQGKIYCCRPGLARDKHTKIGSCAVDAKKWGNLLPYADHKPVADCMLNLGAELHYMSWVSPARQWIISGLFAYSAKDCSTQIMRFFVGDPRLEPIGKAFAVPDTKTLRKIVTDLCQEGRNGKHGPIFMCWACPCK